MKHNLKYLGIGLFIAGLVFSLGERFEIPYIESSTNLSAIADEKRHEKEIATLNKIIASLKDEVQQLNNENEELSKTVSNNTKSTEETNTSGGTNNDNNESNNASDSSSSTADVVTGTIYIYESVSLYDIGQQVEDLNILENGRQLELFLAKPEYSRSIQKGVFELRSDMTLEEMAKILTGKKITN